MQDSWRAMARPETAIVFNRDRKGYRTDPASGELDVNNCHPKRRPIHTAA